MKSLFTVIALIAMYNLCAQDKVKLGTKATLIKELVGEYHINPIKSDSLLALYVHRNMYDVLDESNLFFTREAKARIDSASSFLVSDWDNEESNYFDLVKKEWTIALAQGERAINTFFDQDLSTLKNQEIDTSFLINAATEEAYQKHWNIHLQIRLYAKMIEGLEEENYTYNIAQLEEYRTQSANDLKTELLESLGDIQSEVSILESYYLNALCSGFDPHSSFFTGAQARNLQQSLSREREIFGIRYRKNKKNELEISEVTPGSSAWLSENIYEGDKFLKLRFSLNETIDLKGKSIREIDKLFENNLTTSATLTLENEEDGLREVILKKAPVYSDDDVLRAAWLRGESNIAYFALPDFYSGWGEAKKLGCAADMKKLMSKFPADSTHGCILDLRNNGGGSTQEAIELAGMFIDNGPIVVINETGKLAQIQRDYNRGTIYSGPMIVLINENSASASELVAGALQDYNRALIVGRTSFGKGSGQHVLPFDMNEVTEEYKTELDIDYIKCTNMGFYRLDLTTNQARGVIPNIELKNPRKDSPFHESDYFNAIELKSITKPISYTPLPKIEFSTIKDSSENRQNHDEERIIVGNAYQQIDSLNQLIKINLCDFDKLLGYTKEIEGIHDSMKRKFDFPHGAYTAESIVYDESIFEGKDYMQKFRDDFIESLDKDRGLEEAYRIMLDFIRQ